MKVRVLCCIDSLSASQNKPIVRSVRQHPQAGQDLLSACFYVGKRLPFYALRTHQNLGCPELAQTIRKPLNQCHYFSRTRPTPWRDWFRLAGQHLKNLHLELHPRRRIRGRLHDLVTLLLLRTDRPSSRIEKRLGTCTREGKISQRFSFRRSD